MLFSACDGSGGGSTWSFGSGASTAYPIPDAGGDRVTAEVLNATDRPGAARAGTRRLRESGIDVVFYGNAPQAVGLLDSTRILVRRGPRERGERVRKALGAGNIVVQPDSGRLLDVSVFLGTDFRLPREFDP